MMVEGINEGIILEPEKYKTVLHYIINKCGMKKNVGRTVIHKLLYFSDFNFYELYETSLTGEKYIKYVKGPFSSNFSTFKNELVYEGKIEENKCFEQYRYSSLKEPDISVLTENEIDVIDDVINTISDMTAKEVSDYSHGDLPWSIAEDNEELDYEYVFYRTPEYSVREYNDDEDDLEFYKATQEALDRYDGSKKGMSKEEFLEELASW